MTNGLVLYCTGCNEIISLIVFFFFRSIKGKYTTAGPTQNKMQLTFCLTEVDPMLLDWCLVDLDLQGEGRVVRDLKNRFR